MNHYQVLYEDTLTQFKHQIERARAMNDEARIAWLKEAQHVLNREIADFQAVTGIE